MHLTGNARFERTELEKRIQSAEVPLNNFVSRPHFDEAIVCARDDNWPRISVVTPSYNQGRYLEQTILSVLNQNYPNLEYTIMDGGSGDNSLETIRKYQKYLTHWESNPDSGQSAALVDGFRRSSGDILAYLNSDDVYVPGALKRVGEYFKRNDSTQFIYGDCLMIDPGNATIRRLYPIDFDKDIFLFDNHIIQQQAAFWRRDLYRKVGELNSELCFCMDYDLFARFMAVGTVFVRLDQVLAAFRWHPESKTSRLLALADEEHDEIVRRIVGKPISRWDHIRTRHLRLKRLYREPRAVLQALRSRLWMLRELRDGKDSRERHG
jgi:glycosyltransferase involved in cell wall biosynthesis